MMSNNMQTFVLQQRIHDTFSLGIKDISNDAQNSHDILMILSTDDKLKQEINSSLRNLQIKNPHLTIEYVLKHPEIKWDWYLLSGNKSVANPESLDAYPDVPWDWSQVSRHIPFAYYQSHPEQPWSRRYLCFNSDIPIDYIVEHVLDSSIEIEKYDRSIWAPDMFDKFRADPIKWSFVPNCYNFAQSAPVEVLFANKDIINYDMISTSPHITKEFVIETADRSWAAEFIKLDILDKEVAQAFLKAGNIQKFLFVMVRIVSSTDLDDFLEEYAESLTGRAGFFWLLLTRNASISFSDIVSRPQYPWSLRHAASRADAVEDKVDPQNHNCFRIQQLIYKLRRATTWELAYNIAIENRDLISMYPMCTRELLQHQVNYTEQFRMHMAAWRIQRWWFDHYYNPKNNVCINRLMREANELNHLIICHH